MSNISFKDKNGVITIDTTVKDITLDTGESLINKVSNIDKRTQVITGESELIEASIARLESNYSQVYAITKGAEASIAQLTTTCSCINSSVYTLNSSVDALNSSVYVLWNNRDNSSTSSTTSSQMSQMYTSINQLETRLNETRRSVSTNEKVCASLNAYYNDLLNRVSVLESKLGITNSSTNSSTSSSTNTSTAESSTNSSTNSSTSSSDYLAPYK